MGAHFGGREISGGLKARDCWCSFLVDGRLRTFRVRWKLSFSHAWIPFCLCTNARTFVFLPRRLAEDVSTARPRLRTVEGRSQWTTPASSSCRRSSAKTTAELKVRFFCGVNDGDLFIDLQKVSTLRGGNDEDGDGWRVPFETQDLRGGGKFKQALSELRDVRRGEKMVMDTTRVWFEERDS